ncbi:hypothetical protein V1512DRAFT_257714 [Lipomyces arxii]|uniref:mitochondrial 37S ribosomal protein bS21m n=1 Tax=Lipomyces arxii TaxID=56418 RepID=UPI0034CFAE49
MVNSLRCVRNGLSTVYKKPILVSSRFLSSTAGRFDDKDPKSAKSAGQERLRNIYSEIDKEYVKERSTFKETASIPSPLISRILSDNSRGQRSASTDSTRDELLQRFSPVNIVTLENRPRVGPYSGRTVEVFNPAQLVTRLQVLNRICNANNVSKIANSYKAFEKPNHKRKRLISERTKKKFNKSYGHMVNLMEKYRRMGY